MRTPSTQTKNTRAFFTTMGFNPDDLTVDNLQEIQESMPNHRIVYYNYHHASGVCSLNWAGDDVRSRVIYIVSDGSKWDALTATKGLFGTYLCGACLKTSHQALHDRCKHKCSACSSMLVRGDCVGDLNLRCEDFSFKCKTQKCYDAHKRVKEGVSGQSRCANLKYCISCNSVYRAAIGHTCGDSMYCPLCRDYVSNQHVCSWAPFGEKQRESMKKKQAEFSLAFYDIESTQCTGENPEGGWDYIPQHLCTTISLVKVCYLCEDRPLDENCERCGSRTILFNYESKTEGEFEVVDKFVDWLKTEPTMKNRVLYAHNGGRFDVHLVLRGFLRMGVRPKIVNRGSTVLRAEVRFRYRKLVFKDSYAVIPMALSEFSKSFELQDCEEKGMFPHMANSRSNWGRVWPSIPPKHFFSHEHMKPSQRAAFEEWHASMEGKPWDQDSEIAKYCTGYGAVNQSKIAMKYFKWLERDPTRTYQHAQSPMGELKVKIGHHTYSIDCYEKETHTAIEVMGCYFHGCIDHCYPRGSLLVGRERADELYARTMERVENLKGHFKEVKVIWECRLNEMVDSDDVMKKFFETVEVPERLKMRDALYGGRVEVLRTEYPLGHPKVITSDFKAIVGKELPYRGLIKLRILRPQNLEVAVLPYRHDSALFFANCAACVKQKCEECNHTNERDRSWVGTFATVEVNLALEHNYRVLEVYEVWNWSEWSDQVYRSYFKHFVKSKFAASGFPADVGGDRKKKEEYCAKVSRKLGFDLQPEEVIKSSALRTVCKLCCNSGWGKLAEVPTHSKSEFLSIDDYLKLQLDASREIIDLQSVDRDTLLVKHKPKIESIRANPFSAVHHAIFVTAHARVLLYNIIKRVGSRAAYMDTDSIVFEVDRDEPDPLGDLLTGELGDLTDEVKEGWQIKEAVFAGCKNYSLHLENLTTGEVDYKRAIRGFTKDVSGLSILNHDAIKKLVLKKSPAEGFINVKRPELKRKLGMVYSLNQTKRYRSVSVKRATRGVGETEIKVPFGYIPESI